MFSSGHLHLAGQSMNSLPSQILERKRQLTTTLHKESTSLKTSLIKTEIIQL
jgi:hypothetical protein